MRLIDADVLKEELTSHFDLELEPVIEKYVLRMIDEQPTIDAEPVKHAHIVWEKTNISYQAQCCSNCHRTFISRPDEAIEFCPHCGAKMEGEQHE